MNIGPTTMAEQNQAILAALAHNWQEAIGQNQQILAKNPDDIDALNRLTYAYMQTGEYKKARSFSLKVLLLDRYNTIAVKNLQKIRQRKNLKKRAGSKALSPKLTSLPSLFLEEPGKTRIITLINVAPKSVLYQLAVGDSVSLIEKRHTLEVRSHDKTYLGALPDDLGFRLRRLIGFGNSYETFVKSVGPNSVSVFVKEVKRARRFKNQPSFPATNEYSNYTFSPSPVWALSEDERLSSGEGALDDPEE